MLQALSILTCIDLDCPRSLDLVLLVADLVFGVMAFSASILMRMAQSLMSVALDLYARRPSSLQVDTSSKPSVQRYFESTHLLLTSAQLLLELGHILIDLGRVRSDQSLHLGQWQCKKGVSYLVPKS